MHKPQRHATFAVLPILVAIALSGCGAGDEESDVAITPSVVRADRRAYDGAPPVIPHEPLGAACTSCHDVAGKQVPNLGFAPANPHNKSSFVGATTNCRQCHLFARTGESFVESDFVGVRQDLRRGERLYAGAPPVIPHTVFMRENCLACHSGPSARPEIRCSHPQRMNCGQCHLTQQTLPDSNWPE